MNLWVTASSVLPVWSQQEVAERLGDVQFIAVVDESEVKFDGALARCVELLAGITNQQEHDFVLNLTAILDPTDQLDFWIGIQELDL